MGNVYSGAGATPRIAPLPRSRGLIYKAPLPRGGTFNPIKKITPFRELLLIRANYNQEPY